MIETLPSAWRIFLANIVLGRNVGDLIARLNSLDSECALLRSNKEASRTFVETLCKECLMCKSETAEQRKTKSPRIKYHDPIIGLPDGSTLIHDFVDHIRTLLRGILSSKKERIDIPYTVMIFQLKKDTPVTLNTLRAFTTILQHYLRRSTQRIGYLGKNRFVVVNINSSPRQAAALERSVHSAMTRIPKMKDVVFSIGSSESSISFTPEMRGMGAAIDTARQLSHGNDLRDTIHEALRDIRRSRGN